MPVVSVATIQPEVVSNGSTSPDEGDGLALEDGLAEADGLRDGDALLDGLTEEEGETLDEGDTPPGDGLALELGLTDADGETEADADADGETLADALLLGLVDADGLTLADVLLEGLTEGDTEDEGDPAERLPAAQSSICVVVALSYPHRPPAPELIELSVCAPMPNVLPFSFGVSVVPLTSSLYVRPAVHAAPVDPICVQEPPTDLKRYDSLDCP